LSTAQADINLKKHIVRTLLYYDIFNYPLKSSEVFQFLGTNSISEPDVRDALNSLADEFVVFRFEDFYCLQPAESIIQRRKKGNHAAEGFYQLATKKAAFIAAFPFVRGVLASGSLAKGYMDEKSDLDFFIITAPGRLWIARTLLVAYKRLFLSNSHKYFCVNYFVDEDHLEIEEKNLFTATEVATAMPMYGAEYYKRFMSVNPWVKVFFPNYKPRSTEQVPEYINQGPKRIVEWLLNRLQADSIESFFRQITRNRWKKLYEKQYPAADFEVAFKSKDYASKNHPQHFQRKVMDLYAKKVEEFDFPSWQEKTADKSVEHDIRQ
jgi:hypothetical protein